MKETYLHGEFTSISEFSDERFTNYLRLKREQLDCGHKIISHQILAEGCNAHQPNRNKEKLALQYINHKDTPKFCSHVPGRRRNLYAENKLTKSNTSLHLGGPVLHHNVASCM